MVEFERHPPFLIVAAIFLLAIIITCAVLTGFYWRNFNSAGWQAAAIIGMVVLLVCMIACVVPLGCTLAEGDRCPPWATAANGLCDGATNRLVLPVALRDPTIKAY